MDVVLDRHLTALTEAIPRFRGTAGQLARWGRALACVLGEGGRLLVAGNGGSAEQAQHLAAELVGKLRDDRPALSAIALGSEPAAVTAISNDYGYEDVFARQVRAHGRAGDVLLLLSTSGRSANLTAAAVAAAERGMRCWAFTGPAPNPLAERVEVLPVPSSESQVVQELHLVAIHLLCEYVDRALPTASGPAVATTPAAPVVTAPSVTGPGDVEVAGAELAGVETAGWRPGGRSDR